VQVKGPNGEGFLSDVKAIAGGENHSLALKNDGTVWGWGLGDYGQLGNGSSGVNEHSRTPVQVKGPNGEGFLSDVKAIAGGENHSLALKNDGTVWGWGHNGFGELGNGTTSNTNSTPVQASGLSGVNSIAAGFRYSMALTSSDAAVDNTAPKVTSTIPKANADEVAPTANVRAIFSEEMDRNTINGQTFKLFKKGTTTQIPAQVSYNADTDTAKLDPTNNLRRGVAYEAVVSTWAKDMVGNRLDQNGTTSGLQQMRWFFRVDD
jgi:alpha-tubulin suppressor-like RCC1 family protein